MVYHPVVLANPESLGHRGEGDRGGTVV